MKIYGPKTKGNKKHENVVVLLAYRFAFKFKKNLSKFSSKYQKIVKNDSILL